MIRSSFAATAAVIAALAFAPPAATHPHVFIDTRIAFVIGEGGTLDGLDITWRFDAFLTLFSLAEESIAPDAEGALEPADAEHMARVYADWQPTFDGFAKLTVDGRAAALAPPERFSARLVDGELEIGFSRALAAPASLIGTKAEIAVYEETYYYAVTVAEAPKIIGHADGCKATLNPFKRDASTAKLQVTLFELGREETPSIEGVGALFADRIVLTCE